MPRTSCPAARVPVLALGAALLAGCAAGGGGGAQARPSAPPLDELVEAGAVSTVEAGSSKVSLTSETSTGGLDVVFVGEGVYDPQAQEGELTFSVPGAEGTPAAGGTIEQRLIGDDLYLALPQPPGVFYRLRLADVATTSLGSSTDPTASLQALRELTDVEQVGPGEVRGVATTRYRGELDVEAAIDGASGNAKRVLETTLREVDAERVPFEADLDGEGRLVRLVQQLQLPAGPATGGREVRSRTTLELYDFGTEVDVAVPPPASVRDGAPLLAALRGAPGPSTSPSPER